ncbi:MAG: hypothetical protein IPJ56_01455 [Gemmatimonadetes bacterium]|nr:hypothetical protein [Gemmatimonadota bacterium]
MQDFEARHRQQYERQQSEARIVRPSEHQTARQMTEMQSGQAQYERGQSAMTADKGREAALAHSQQVRGPEADEAYAKRVEQDVERRQGKEPYEDDQGAAFHKKTEGPASPGRSESSSARQHDEHAQQRVNSSVWQEERSSDARAHQKAQTEREDFERDKGAGPKPEREGPHIGDDNSDSNSNPRKGITEHRSGAWSAPAQPASDRERAEARELQAEARSMEARETKSRGVEHSEARDTPEPRRESRERKGE